MVLCFSEAYNGRAKFNGIKSGESSVVTTVSAFYGVKIIEPRSDECDIGFQVQLDAEIPNQVMDFP